MFAFVPLHSAHGKRLRFSHLVQRDKDSSMGFLCGNPQVRPRWGVWMTLRKELALEGMVAVRISVKNLGFEINTVGIVHLYP